MAGRTDQRRIGGQVVITDRALGRKHSVVEEKTVVAQIGGIVIIAVNQLCDEIEAPIQRVDTPREC